MKLPQATSKHMIIYFTFAARVNTRVNTRVKIYCNRILLLHHFQMEININIPKVELKLKIVAYLQHFIVSNTLLYMKKPQSFFIKSFIKES